MPQFRPAKLPLWNLSLINYGSTHLCFLFPWFWVNYFWTGCLLGSVEKILISSLQLVKKPSYLSGLFLSLTDKRATKFLSSKILLRWTVSFRIYSWKVSSISSCRESGASFTSPGRTLQLFPPHSPRKPGYSYVGEVQQTCHSAMTDASRTKLYTHPKVGTIKSRSVTRAMRKLENFGTRGRGTFPARSLWKGGGGRESQWLPHSFS